MPVRHTQKQLAKVTQRGEVYSVKFRQMYSPVVMYNGVFFRVQVGVETNHNPLDTSWILSHRGYKYTIASILGAKIG